MRYPQTLQLRLTNKKGDAVHIEKFGYKNKDNLREQFQSAVNDYPTGKTWLDLLRDEAFLTHLEDYGFFVIVYANEYRNGNNVFTDVWSQPADAIKQRPALPAIAAM